MPTILKPDNQPITVEYTSNGARTTKVLPTSVAAKRFYTKKFKEGKEPRVVGDTPLPEEPVADEPGKHVAVYVRVSTVRQDTKSQEPDLERWASSQQQPVVWYRDKASGKKMDRPGWTKLEQAMRLGKVEQVVVWRLDRLGRTASGLTRLFDELRDRKVNLVSLKDGLDLATPAGRLMANVLASVAQYETEVRGERVAAGQAVARSKGKRWGGSKAGVRKKVTPTQIKAARTMKAAGEPIAQIAKALGLSRPTVYDVLGS